MKKLVLIASSILLSSSVYASGIVGDTHDPGQHVYQDFPELFATDQVAKNDEESKTMSQPEVGDSNDSYLDEILKVQEIMP